MTKTLDRACPSGSCCGRCPNAVTRPLAAVPGSAGLGAGTRDETLDRSGASLVQRYKAGLLKTLGLYREMVGLEIGRASEYGASWWSRRLVEVSEEAGLVRLDQ